MDQSGAVTQADVELLLQTLNETGAGEAAPESSTGDVNGDGQITPHDALAIVNQLNAAQPQDTEDTSGALEGVLPIDTATEELLTALAEDLESALASA